MPGRNRFQVSLEFGSFVVIGGNELPGAEFGGVGRLTGIVGGKSLVEVGGEADIAL